MRKYQLSVSLSSDLIDLIEKKSEEGEYSSRSQFIEKLLRENIDEHCIQCVIDQKLRNHNIDSRNIEFPITMEEADEIIEKEKSRPRNNRIRERTILEIVRRIHVETGQVVSLNDVLTEANRCDISRDAAEDLVDALCRDGKLMRPGGYQTPQPV